MVEKVWGESKLEDFRLMSKLGEGTFSVVLKVKHKKTGSAFAMKRFRKTFQSFEDVEGLREIQALRRLNPHPHIISLEDIIFEPKHGILSLNFELMDCNLYELISKKSPSVTEEKAKLYMWHICKALEYIHGNGIFHRDIKPENILVRDGHLKIADFGSCRGIHSKQPFTEYIATRWYRSPECLLCDGMYNYKMDMWSAGCVLFEIVSRDPLFPGTDELDQLHKIHGVLGTPSQKVLRHMLGNRVSSVKYNFPTKEGTGLKCLVPTASPECLELMEFLLAYNPDERYSSKEALRHNYFAEMQYKENGKIPEETVHPVKKKKSQLLLESMPTTIQNSLTQAANAYLKPALQHEVTGKSNINLESVANVSVSNKENQIIKEDHSEIAQNSLSEKQALNAKKEQLLETTIKKDTMPSTWEITKTEDYTNNINKDSKLADQNEPKKQISQISLKNNNAPKTEATTLQKKMQSFHQVSDGKDNTPQLPSVNLMYQNSVINQHQVQHQTQEKIENLKLPDLTNSNNYYDVKDINENVKKVNRDLQEGGQQHPIVQRRTRRRHDSPKGPRYPGGKRRLIGNDTSSTRNQGNLGIIGKHAQVTVPKLPSLSNQYQINHNPQKISKMNNSNVNNTLPSLNVEQQKYKTEVATKENLPNLPVIFQNETMNGLKNINTLPSIKKR
ncbi:hypothetical protein HK099_008128 [Clydaea vesicula]|uniref:Protein kinase domain-containing protein n=1 Tax=Clydaea vesicula TaxID=447962 RepID=A0AAD5XTB3_9FUNG|nr:hypothetical protein HK099_008128 [Clydaea vesicula]